MPFTEKSSQIEALMEVVAGNKREEGKCVFRNTYPDQKHSLEFRDQLSRKEYTISGMCQSCQDLAFREEGGE